MKLRVERDTYSTKYTLGQLLIDGMEECYTLEDGVKEKEGVPVEEWKVPGETAIPKGTYNVVVTYSNRFKRDLPLLENVPGFTGIRIHPGNTHEDTEGCILVGRKRTDRTVVESRIAFNELFRKIEEALEQGDTVTIEVS